MASTISDINGKVTVGVPIERAFQVFTARLGTWWPSDYHIGGAEMADAILEPRAGGRWYERGVDGTECDWGTVLEWEPPVRLVVTWQINGEWKYDADPARASEIEVRFIADGPEQTTVELQHRHLDRLVLGEALYQAISGAGGWKSVLEAYAAAASKQD
jgi:uncharacterized protein YndB with AHSA1/START domain